MPRRSEFDLIAALRERLPAPGPRVAIGSGDDGAVVRAGGAASVVSVDTTVDGVHARLDLGEPLRAARDFGWRALTTALSDLAAMGAPAGEAYVALTLPADLEDALALALADGMGEAAARYGVSVIGGDVSSGPAVVISVTVVGWSGGGEALRRAGAQAGNLVGLTGAVGASGAGLALVVGDAAGAGLEADIAAELRAAYLRPEPHLRAGAALLAAGAAAAIDISDGVLADAGHVAEASGVTLALDGASVPLAPGVAEVAQELGRDPGEFALASGEDFVLLVAVPPERRAAAEAAGVIAWIGVVEIPGASGPGVMLDGAPADGRGGHDHRA